MSEGMKEGRNVFISGINQANTHTDYNTTSMSETTTLQYSVSQNRCQNNSIWTKIENTFILAVICVVVLIY